MLDVNEAIEQWQQFESRATRARTTQIDRIKEDRAFLGGQQWDKDDDNAVPATRIRRTVNVISNPINSVVNQYAGYGYKFYSDDEKVDAAADAFLKFGSNERAALDVLRSEVSFGLGYFAIGSETIYADGQEIDVPALYSIDNVETVYFDPDSVAYDGGDAMAAGIVELRSKEYVKAKYGPEYVTSEGTRSIVNVSDNKDSEKMAIVTFYRVENGKCAVYRLLNDRFLEAPVELDIPRVPVFPCYGEATWEPDGHKLYQGLIRRGRPIQKLINLAYTQLAERMAKAPKCVWLTTPESVEDYDDGYKNFDKNMNPLLLWNDKSEDGKREFPKPERIDNQVQFGDITGIIDSNMGLLSAMTGVDVKGLVDAPQITATEAILNKKEMVLTTRHYFSNLKTSFRAVGETILALLNFGKVHLEVIQGPDEEMTKQEARQELMTIAPIVPDQDKMKVVNGILLSHNDNPILREVFGALNAVQAPTAMEQQAFDTIEQMKQAIDQKNAQIQELEEQIKRFDEYQNNNERDLQAKFAEINLNHQNKLEEMAFQKELDGGADAEKAQLDSQKAQVDLQKSAIQLQTAEVKAGAEQTKAILSMIPQNKEVNDENYARN